MPLSRLLRPKSTFNLCMLEPKKTTRWCSSVCTDKTEKSSPSKKSNTTKMQREIAAESYVKEYMQTHPGVFPKATHVRSKVGGSWYTLKDILTSLKEKMLGNPPLQNHPTDGTSNSPLGPAETVVITSQISPDKIEPGESENTVLNCHLNEKNSSTFQTREIPSEEMINASFEVTRTKSYPDDTKLVESVSIDQLLQPVLDSQNDEEKISFESFEGCEKSKSEKLACLELNIPNEAARKSTSSLKSNLGSKVDETPASLSEAQKVIGLADLFMRMNNRAAGEITHKKSDILTPKGFEKRSTEASGNDMEKVSAIKGLISYLTDIPKEQMDYKTQANRVFDKTDQTSGRHPLGGKKSQPNLQAFETKGKGTPMSGNKLDNTDPKSEDEEGRDTKVASFESTKSKKSSQQEEGRDTNVASFKSTKSKTSQQVPLRSSKEGYSETWDPSFSKKGSGQNKVLVRFLRNEADERDLIAAFKDCGPIMKIEFSNVKGSIYKMANVYFETRKGLNKALEKTDIVVRNENLTVEVASSSDNVHTKISIPDLIGDPDVPASVVRNPTRTVMIKQLTHEISSRHIEEALAFCESNITGFFLGSSSFVSYVEFETEDAKEKALAKHSILVQGKRLFICRIDAPKTTVVRISNIKECGPPAVLAICKSFGQVRCTYSRSRDIMDVHYKITEWPNMLKILNRLNGMEVDGRRLVAQSAPVFPHEILQILWSQPNERERVLALVHGLFRKLGENSLNKGLLDLAAKYYEHDILH